MIFAIDLVSNNEAMFIRSIELFRGSNIQPSLTELMPIEWSFGT